MMELGSTRAAQLHHAEAARPLELMLVMILVSLGLVKS